MINGNYSAISFSSQSNSFTRVDANHILDIYLGRDHASRCTLLLLTDTEPPNVLSSQFIDIAVGKRKDGKWSLSFSLLDDRYYDLFCHFCADMIESSRTLTEQRKGPRFLCIRYNKWQRMLKNNPTGILSTNEIKGLIGELLYLKTVMIPSYEDINAVESWLGPEGADQDFVIGDTWHEVKTTVSGSASIKISSLEQLDREEPGVLAILYLDKTSTTDKNGITLNDLYDELLDVLDPTVVPRFKNLLINKGYIRIDEYDDYAFCLKEMSQYTVKDSFPRLRRCNVPNGVENAVYELSIPMIKDYMKRK